MPRVEQSVLVLKPEGFKYRDQVLHLLMVHAFFVCQTKDPSPLTETDVAFLYPDQRNKRHYASLVSHLTTGGPSMVLILAKINGCSELKSLLGPKSVVTARSQKPRSLRALFGKTELKNGFHASSKVLNISLDKNNKIGNIWKYLE